MFMEKAKGQMVRIPLKMYRQLVLELKDKAQKEIDHGNFDMKKISELRKEVKKLNPEVFKNE